MPEILPRRVLSARDKAKYRRRYCDRSIVMLRHLVLAERRQMAVGGARIPLAVPRVPAVGSRLEQWSLVITLAIDALAYHSTHQIRQPAKASNISRLMMSSGLTHFMNQHSIDKRN